MEKYLPFGVFVICSVILVVSAFLYRPQKSSGKSAKFFDILLVWPMILRGERSRREKVFIVVGFLTAAALIASSFFLPH